MKSKNIILRSLFFIIYLLVVIIVNNFYDNVSNEFEKNFATFLFMFVLSIPFLMTFEIKYRKVLLSAFITRFFASIISFSGIFPLEGSIEDASYFREISELMMADGLEGLIRNFVIYLSNAYSLFISFITLIFGDNKAFICTINVFFGVFVVWRIGQIGEILYDNTVKVKSMWISTFVLYLVIFSATPIRESLHIFFISSATYFFLKFTKNGKLLSFFFSMFFGILSVMFHSALFGFLFVLILLIVFQSFKSSKEVSKSSFSKYFIMVFIIVTLPLLFNGITSGSIKLYKLDGYSNDNAGEDFDDYLFRNAGTAVASSGTYRQDFKIKGITDFLFLLPNSLIPFFFKPYPWELFKIRYPFLYIHSFMWIYFFYLFIGKFSFFKANKNSIYILLISLSILIPYSFGSFQINQAIRHNTKSLPIIIPLLAPLVFKNRTSKAKYNNQLN